jgi:hypothetical protein
MLEQWPYRTSWLLLAVIESYEKRQFLLDLGIEQNIINNDPRTLSCGIYPNTMSLLSLYRRLQSSIYGHQLSSGNNISHDHLYESNQRHIHLIDDMLNMDSDCE